MKILLFVLGLLIVGITLVADYKWKQWIAARRAERDHDPYNRR